MQDSFLRPRLEQGKLNQSARISGPDAKLPNIICIPLYQHRQWPKASKPNCKTTVWSWLHLILCKQKRFDVRLTPHMHLVVQLVSDAVSAFLGLPPQFVSHLVSHVVSPTWFGMLYNAVSAFLGLPSNNLVWDAVSASLGLYPGLSPVLSLNLSPILSSSWSGMLSPLACLRSYLQLVCDAGLCHCGATHCKNKYCCNCLVCFGFFVACLFRVGCTLSVVCRSFVMSV